MKFWTIVFFISAFIFFFLQTMVLAAEPSCPRLESPETVAIKYRLYSAYQTGFGGYEAPCEMKCFGNANCQKRCQGKKGLEYLSLKMADIVKEHNSVQCPSLTVACVEQCQELGASCAAVCGSDRPLAKKDTP